MSKDIYVVDTHALAWFISQDNRLSLKAAEILHQGELGKMQILIPTLVLAEITHIAEKKRVNVTINEILSKINQGDGFNIVAFDFPIFNMMLSLPQDWDIHDRIISATALYYQATLITRDNILQDHEGLQTIWD